MSERKTIKINQIWRNKKNRMQVIITGKKGSSWKTRVLTEKPDVYAGTHTLNQYTLWAKFELL